MKRLLLLGRNGEESSTSGAGERRRSALVSALGDGASLLVACDGSPAVPPPAGAVVVPLDRDVFATGLAVDGLVRDFAPDEIVAVGRTAVFVPGRLTSAPPLWIDVDFALGGTPSTADRPWGRDSLRDLLHDLVWSLDRADRVGCATPAIADALRLALRLRGRELAGSPSGEPPLVVEPGDDGFPRLREWLGAPERAHGGPRVLGAAEISSFSRQQALEGALARERARLAGRIGRSFGRGARAVRHELRDAARFVRRALAAPAVLLGGRVGPGAPPHDPFASRSATAETTGGRRPRVLIVMPYRIFPVRHGGAVRLSGLLRELSESCELHLLRFDQRGENRLERRELERFCRRVEFHHWVVPPDDAAPDPRLPPFVSVFADEKVKWRIRQWVATEGIDVVQFEYVEMGQFRRAAFPARTILVEHDLAFRSQQRKRDLDIVGRFGNEVSQRISRMDLARLRAYELGAVRGADQIHFMSRSDADAFVPLLPDGARRVRVVPNAVDTAALAPPSGVERSRDLLFVGNFGNLPNCDALEWLLDAIWPRIRERASDAALTVVGAGLPEALAAKARLAGADVVGEVESIARLLHVHRLLLVPLRAGSGTRLKILEAFAAGIAVVSTPLGVEGIRATAGAELEVAESADDFASAVVALRADPVRREAMASAALALVAREYDVAHAAALNLEAIRELCADGPEPAESRPHRLLSPEARDGAPAPDISIVIPTRRGGVLLERTLEAIGRQVAAPKFEVVCVDSGSDPSELAAMRRHGVRLVEIDPATFDHGRTRDLGAAHARGRVLVFLNQDAVPASDDWLERLTRPLFAAVAPAAVQGGILEFPVGAPDVPPRFYWDSGGPRFNFTSESRDWIARSGGIGFSTVNCAIRREVWREIPFGVLPILEDKLWQERALAREYRIVAVPEAAVRHTHGYDLGDLVRRSRQEGAGWRRLGERYRLSRALADVASRALWSDWWRGVRSRRVKTFAELLFPLARPYGLWSGNRSAGREVEGAAR